MQTPTDNETGRTETSAGGELISFEVDTVQEPYEGMLFESEGAAKEFYDEYARRVGFVTRVLSSRKSERDGSIISRGLGCRGGFDNQKTRHLQTQKRDRRREGCTAMILAKREKPGQWIVRKFVRDHNHPLVVQLQKSRPTLVSFLSLVFSHVLLILPEGSQFVLPLLFLVLISRRFAEMIGIFFSSEIFYEF